MNSLWFNAEDAVEFLHEDNGISAIGVGKDAVALVG